MSIMILVYEKYIKLFFNYSNYIIVYLFNFVLKIKKIDFYT